MIEDPRIDRALARAREVRAGAAGPGEPDARPARVVAIGDPQTSAARLFGALAAHGLLGDDGWLRPDVRLIAMGDYFDYQVAERERARVEGVLILGWLAAHARGHVTVLLGNHDAARVMELATVDDARFGAAAEAAAAVVAVPRAERGAAVAAFRARFPELATPGYAARDYNAFTVEQRALVQRLLIAGRISLATTARVRGVAALLTHAGVTHRELAMLCVRDHHARTIADALDDRLGGAVRQVAGAWRAGQLAPLSLEPLHVAGAHGEEGGGLLYHRPADPERPGADPGWEMAARAPRRFDPRTELPRGLTQVIGHTGHRKASQEMARWLAPGTDTAAGGVRTLRVTVDRTVCYARGVDPSDGRDAVAYLIDPEMHHVTAATEVAVLELDAGGAAAG